MNSAGTTVLDQERRVALAPEVGHVAFDAEHFVGDVGNFFGSEPRRLCLQDRRQGSSITGQPRRYAAPAGPRSSVDRAAVS